MDIEMLKGETNQQREDEVGLEDKGERKGRDDSDMKNVTLKRRGERRLGLSDIR